MSSTWLSEEDLSCPICHSIFENPVLMPCSHSFCKACVEKLVWQTTTWQCPVCRRRSSESSFPLNLALKNVCEAYQQHSSGPRPSVSRNQQGLLRFGHFLFGMSVFILLLTGPKQHTWKSQHSALADKNHILYRLGLSLNSVWALTSIFTGSFTFLVSFSLHHSLSVSLRHLSRLLISTVVWLGLHRLSTSLEETLGFCFESQSRIFGFGTSSLLFRDGESKTSCLHDGFQWCGFEVSQEALLLCMCCLLLMEEAAMFGQYMESPETHLHHLIVLCFYYLAVWFFLLFVFLVSLTQFPSQQTGVILGYLAWLVLYQVWFRKDPSWCCPGPPILAKDAAPPMRVDAATNPSCQL